MKKIFTLFAGLLMAAAVFAADRRPVVTIDNNRNFKVVIDGKSYFGDNIRIRLDNFYGSRFHTIKVYEMRRGFFMRERLVDATTFQLGRNDVMIRVDRFGQIRIREMRGYGRYDRNERDWNDADGRNWNGKGFDEQDQKGFEGQDPRDGRDNRDGRGRGF